MKYPKKLNQEIKKLNEFFYNWLNELFEELEKCGKATLYINLYNNEKFSIEKTILELIPLDSKDDFGFLNQFNKDYCKGMVFFKLENPIGDDFFYPNRSYRFLEIPNNFENSINVFKIYTEIYTIDWVKTTKIECLFNFLNRLFNTPFVCKEHSIIKILKNLLEKEKDINKILKEFYTFIEKDEEHKNKIFSNNTTSITNRTISSSNSNSGNESWRGKNPCDMSSQEYSDYCQWCANRSGQYDCW